MNKMLSPIRVGRLIASFGIVLGLVLLTSCGPNKSEGLGVYPKAMGAADEGSAIQTLRTIATAEAQLKASRGSYGDFEALTQAGYLDSRFAAPTPNQRGYRFAITASESEFSVTADPQTTETQPTTGVRHFYLEGSDNAVHANPTRAASKGDPVVGT
ncbi:MAG: hypothetical protein QOK48_3471 [Blastocatellia bacterium]|nr:hypothetical protein [Blastocatellia bacterium]